MGSNLQQMEQTVAATQLESRQAQVEVDRRLTLATDNHQVERNLHMEESGKVSGQVEALRRISEKDVAERAHLASAFSRLSQDLCKRADDEMAAREADVARLHKIITEEKEFREQSEKKLEKSLFALEESHGGASTSRVREIKEMQRQIGECKSELEFRLAQHTRFDEELLKQRHAILEDQRLRDSHHADLSATVTEHRKLFDQTHGALNELAQRHDSMQTSIAQMVQRGLGNEQVKEEFKNMAKSLEIEIQGGAIRKLREECKEAMHREVRSRIDHDNSLSEALEQETSARMESIRSIERVLEDMRQGMMLGSTTIVGNSRPISPMNGRIVAAAKSAAMTALMPPA